MGVTGLWRLIEPAGKPVPIEILENNVLAVDISIWLHQVVKGYQNAKGAPMPNAHLLGLFQRLCKLLYYRIKPVFVFDGGYPDLKKETIAKRQDSKAKFNSESERLKREIMLLLGKRTAIHSILGEGSSVSPTKSPKKATNSNISADDIFKLPEIPKNDSTTMSSETESETDDDDCVPVIDLHSVDIESETFKSLPLREKHDLLTELKETRKMNSWGRLQELPKESGDFSNYQMNRLLKRRKVQECLEDTEKEMGGNFMSINELENLLNEEGIETKLDSLPTRRIAYDDRTRYLLIKDMKKAKEEAREAEKKKLLDKQMKEAEKVTEKKVETVDEELQRAIQMSLECEEGKKNESSPDSTFTLDTDYSESEEEEQCPFIEFNSAKSYIIQNTDFTEGAIDAIISSKSVINENSKYKRKKSNQSNEVSENKPKELSSESDEGNNEDINADDTSNMSSEKIINTSSSDIINLNSSLETKHDYIIKKGDKAIELIASSSDEDCREINQDSLEQIVNESELESSGDDDFEEVAENVKSNSKVIAELKINYENKIEDDIFADVFVNEAKNENQKICLVNNDVIEPQINIFISSENIDTSANLSTQKIYKDAACVFVDDNQTSKTAQYDKVDLKSVELHVIDEHKEVIDELKEDIAKQEEVMDKHEEVTDEHKKVIEIEPPKTPPRETKSDSNEKYSETIDSVEAIIDKPKLTNEELTEMAENLRKEEQLLEEEKGKLDRMSRNISDEMTRDAKELLRMFGIPYIVAPTEAEAQCAFLECANLTDGTITDDSDIWLFGGRTVYKNFFDQRKHVLQFQAEKIERSFNLPRDQLILLALLVGSDYTLGVRGVGPVTAMEILASFPPTRKDKLTAETATSLQVKSSALLVGLQEFKRWVKSGKRTDDTSLRNKLKHINVSDDFPSVRVVQAYLEPTVNKSKETFTWGRPDVTTLRDFSRNKFGWSQTKFDEIITPVLKRMQDTKAQKSLKDYFKNHFEYQDVQLSKRVKAAVEKMGPETQAINNKQKPVRKRKAKEKVESELFSKLEDDNPAATTSKQISNSESVSSESFDIKVPKLNRYQEVIPQREKDRLNVVQTKLRAIELYRKTKIDKQIKKKKRMAPKPKEDAGLSESDSD